MKRWLVPKYYYEIPKNPVIFLSGPIHGAPKWQSEAAKMIFKKTKDIVVASPRRVLGEYVPEGYFRDAEYSFFRQRPWEKYYMKRAAEGGAILFWLSGPDEKFITKDMVYGATTRFELGEWMTRYEMNNSLGLVIGGEDNFPTIHTIKYDKFDLMNDATMISDLEELVDQAIEVAYKNFARYNHIPDDVNKIKGLDKIDV